MKKAAALILAAAIMVSCAGCASFLEDEYSYSEPHTFQDKSVPSNAAIIVEATDYAGLMQSIVRFVENHVEYGVIRVGLYSGDIEADIPAACMEITNDTAIGAYSVYYIDHSLYRVVSYYEISLNITYRRTKEDLSSIVRVNTQEELQELFFDAMENGEEELTLRTSLPRQSGESISEFVEQLYYAEPERVVFLPAVSASVYPESDAGGTVPMGDRIVELTLHYPNSPNIVRMKHDMLTACVDLMMKNFDDAEGGSDAEKLCSLIRSSVNYDSNRDAANVHDSSEEVFTAYGAVVSGSAASDGIAMTMKLLCNRLGIECWVVRGRMDNVTHAWNIVRLEDGGYYHVDLSSPEELVFKNDVEMADSYWWENSEYPSCQGDSLVPDAPPVTVPDDTPAETLPLLPEPLPVIGSP